MDHQKSVAALMQPRKTRIPFGINESRSSMKRRKPGNQSRREETGRARDTTVSGASHPNTFRLGAIRMAVKRYKSGPDCLVIQARCDARWNEDGAVSCNPGREASRLPAPLPGERRKQRTDVKSTGECRRVSADCSEWNADSHLKFIWSEALPEQTSNAGVRLRGRAVIQRTV